MPQEYLWENVYRYFETKDAIAEAVIALTDFTGACGVVVTPKGFVYGSTGTSSIINGYSLSTSGGFTEIGTGDAATIPGSTILDLAVSSDGVFLHSLNSGNGTIGLRTINQSTGVLTANVGAVLPKSDAAAGLNGIAAY